MHAQDRYSGEFESPWILLDDPSILECSSIKHPQDRVCPECKSEGNTRVSFPQAHLHIIILRFPPID